MLVPTLLCLIYLTQHPTFIYCPSPIPVTSRFARVLSWAGKAFLYALTFGWDHTGLSLYLMMKNLTLSVTLQS